MVDQTTWVKWGKFLTIHRCLPQSMQIQLLSDGRAPLNPFKNCISLLVEFEMSKGCWNLYPWSHAVLWPWALPIGRQFHVFCVCLLSISISWPNTTVTASDQVSSSILQLASQRALLGVPQYLTLYCHETLLADKDRPFHNIKCSCADLPSARHKLDVSEVPSLLPWVGRQSKAFY